MLTPQGITPDLLVTDIVDNNYRTAEVFRKYDIDFCCGGRMSLAAACELKHTDQAVIIDELMYVDYAYQNADQWSADFMIDYLLNIYHGYFKKNLPVVQYYIERFMTSHSAGFPNIQALPEVMQQLYKKLYDLINYESEQLFPYIKRLYFAYNNNGEYARLFIKTLRKLSTKDFEQYHDRINAIIVQVENLTHHFALPEKACSTHKVMIRKLDEFITTVKQHMLMEKKFLIPLTLQMETKLLENYKEIQ